MNLFARANRLRFACEFDKAAGIYESILADFPEEAEGYWGLVLCKYGIEYVDDPATAKKVPTCHRSSFDSIMDDPDYEQALENADAVARSVYRSEAKQIEEIRKGIIEVSSKEEPYDIFICYKETAEDGQRTIDSVLAQDVYDVLTDKGYRTFFARITLEDKLGQEYEPYIFAALNSAKVMLAFGTDYEYFNVVWVKNEWSRYLKLMEKDKEKHLIPCYKDIDAYDIPKEFVRLQAQDLGKVGAVQDLVRGIGKIIGEKKVQSNPISSIVSPEGALLVQRGNMALEDEDFKGAEGYFERALDANPADAYAYLGKFLAYYRLKSLDDMKDKVWLLEENKDFRRADQFADAELSKTIRRVKENNSLKIERLRVIDLLKKYSKKAAGEELIYNRGKKLLENAAAEDACMEAEKVFESILQYKDSAALVKECREKAEILKKEDLFAEARFQELLSEYRTLSKKVKSHSEEQQIREQIEKLSVEKEEVTQLAAAFPENSRALAEAEQESAAKKEKRDALQKERVSLGIFAGKRKKEIDGNVEVLNRDIETLYLKVTQLKNALCGYSSADEISKKINAVEKQITELQFIISESEQSKNTFEAVKKELFTEKNLKYISGKEELHPLAIKLAKVGDYVKFGTYMQEAYSNRKEKIEWLVLDKKYGRILLLSKYGLDCQCYNESRRNLTWETCTLRKWLNNQFFHTAFSEKEKSLISKVGVSDDKIPKYSTNPGNETQDQVFLLSIKEVNRYLKKDKVRQCQPTDYAVAKGVFAYSANDNCRWWLRSPGYSQLDAAYVSVDGGVVENGHVVDYDTDAVRPALWIDLNSVIF